jgi:hypothetical protein
VRVPEPCGSKDSVRREVFVRADHLARGPHVEPGSAGIGVAGRRVHRVARSQRPIRRPHAPRIISRGRAGGNGEVRAGEDEPHPLSWGRLGRSPRMSAPVRPLRPVSAGEARRRRGWLVEGRRPQPATSPVSATSISHPRRCQPTARVNPGHASPASSETTAVGLPSWPNNPEVRDRAGPSDPNLSGVAGGS